MRYLNNDPAKPFQQRFQAAMQRTRERADASKLSLTLDPETSSDFKRALANIELIVAAMASGSENAYSSAMRIARETHNHMADEQLACDLYMLWIELSDLYEFTDEGSRGEHAAELAMRQAATEWLNPKRNQPEWLRDYFDRWAAARDPGLWRNRLGGPLFDSMDASGWFRWDR